jgi:hypothetical protein
MESEGSLPCSQKHATRPYPKPDASSQHLSHELVKDSSANSTELVVDGYTRHKLICQFRTACIPITLYCSEILISSSFLLVVKTIFITIIFRSVNEI